MILLSMVSVFAVLSLAEAKPEASVEEAWLASVPVEVHIAVRVRGIDAVRGDLRLFLDSFSKGLVGRVDATLDQMLAPLNDPKAKEIIDPKAPIILMLQFPNNQNLEGDAALLYGVLFKTKSYELVRQSVTGKPNAPGERAVEGYETLKDPLGMPTYVLERKGYVGVSNNQILMRAMASGEKALLTGLGDEHRERFFGGDMGAYINVEALLDRFSGVLGSLGERGLESLARASGGALPAGAVRGAKQASHSVLKRLEGARAMVMSVDAAADGLDLEGDLLSKMPEESKNASSVPLDRLLENLPADMTYYFKLGATDAAWFKSLTLATMFGLRDEQAPQLIKIRSLVDAAGLQEAAVAYHIGDGRPTYLTLAAYDDAAKAVEAYRLSIAALADPATARAAMVDSVVIDPKMQVYRKFNLKHCQIEFSYNGLARNARILLAMAVGQSREIWFGSEGGRVLTIAADDWPSAKARIDSLLDDRAGLGRTKTYELIKKKLPRRADGVFLIRLQGLAVQLARELKVIYPAVAEGGGPTKLPREPALIALAYSRKAGGIRFHLFVPSTVGATIEAGILPIVDAIRSQRQE